MRGHNDKLKPYFGPRRESLQRCMNAMEMFHFTHHRVQCPNGAHNYFACRIRMNILCQSCMWNRGHFETGYGRSIACKCMYCQHFPAHVVGYSEELEYKATGAIAPPPEPQAFAFVNIDG